MFRAQVDRGADALLARLEMSAGSDLPSLWSIKESGFYSRSEEGCWISWGEGVSL